MKIWFHGKTKKINKWDFAELLIETKRRTQSESAHVHVWVWLIHALTNGNDNHTYSSNIGKCFMDFAAGEMIKFMEQQKQRSRSKQAVTRDCGRDRERMKTKDSFFHLQASNRTEKFHQHPKDECESKFVCIESHRIFGWLNV